MTDELEHVQDAEDATALQALEEKTLEDVTADYVLVKHRHLATLIRLVKASKSKESMNA